MSRNKTEEAVSIISLTIKDKKRPRYTALAWERTKNVAVSHKGISIVILVRLYLKVKIDLVVSIHISKTTFES